MLDLMKATVGTKSYFFLSRAASYTGLDTTVGVAPAADTDKDEPKNKVEELQNKGIVFRVVCYLSNKERRQILVTRDKLATALDALPGKTIEGATVVSAGIARRARFI